jgi:hypothetical protein
MASVLLCRGAGSRRRTGSCLLRAAAVFLTFVKRGGDAKRRYRTVMPAKEDQFRLDETIISLAPFG